MQPDEMPSEDELLTFRAGDVRGLLGMVHPERDWEVVPPEITDLLGRVRAQLDAGRQPAEAEDPATPDPAFGDGEFKVISFMGHNTHTGLVREFVKNGQPAYHIDLPGKLWGGNPLDYREYSASAWFSEYPIAEETVRSAWETELRSLAMQAERERLWREQQATHALEAGTGDVWNDDDTDQDADF
jgi:hypothetical protein